jgi:hypothetical protein
MPRRKATSGGAGQMIQCMRCGKKTPTTGLHIVKSGNRHRAVGTCSVCGTQKSQFVSGGGLFGSIAKVVAAPLINAAAGAATNLAGKAIGAGANALANKIAGGGVRMRKSKKGKGLLGSILGTAASFIPI